jgi:hypothetical protein
MRTGEYLSGLFFEIGFSPLLVPVWEQGGWSNQSHPTWRCQMENAKLFGHWMNIKTKEFFWGEVEIVGMTVSKNYGMVYITIDDQKLIKA